MKPCFQLDRMGAACDLRGNLVRGEAVSGRFCRIDGFWAERWRGWGLRGGL